MISTRGRYALRMMIEFAQQEPGVRVPLRIVSARQDISMKYLEQIASMLVQTGFLESSRGPRGGYRLARPADEVTAGDVLRAVEGEFVPIACLGQDYGICPRRDECSTLGFWQGLRDAIDTYIDGVTLADLAAGTACEEQK
ncbi:MAG TPA: Rrf2 family transcriptional regulator [Candidatus Aveggerthella excrementigallinarum]|nr:Rrf2 family transcriptional regulator [Candidatus Aveggerthella excrementigallinarum]